MEALTVCSMMICHSGLCSPERKAGHLSFKIKRLKRHLTHVTVLYLILWRNGDERFNHKLKTCNFKSDYHFAIPDIRNTYHHHLNQEGSLLLIYSTWTTFLVFLPRCKTNITNVMNNSLGFNFTL